GGRPGAEGAPRPRLRLGGGARAGRAVAGALVDHGPDDLVALARLDHRRDPADQVVGRQVHQAHALGRAAGAADGLRLEADDLALLGDQQHLLALAHRAGGDQLALAVADLDRADALGRAALARVLGHRRALPVP